MVLSSKYNILHGAGENDIYLIYLTCTKPFSALNQFNSRMGIPLFHAVWLLNRVNTRVQSIPGTKLRFYGIACFDMI